jgi:excinuclease UvrABC nuclease subunit
VGPFRDKVRCAAFVELLEDLFDLCRKHEILVRAPHGQPCVYAEMGKCPAPCDGSLSMSVYGQMIRDSIDFASGRHDPRIAALEVRMQEAAAAQAFERAGQIRNLLQRVRKMLTSGDRIAETPESFRYLCVQRGGGTARVKPFFVDRGVIVAGEPVKRRDVSEHLPAWIETLSSLRSGETTDAVQRSEGIWLVSHFLLKGDKAPGLLLHEEALGQPDGVAALIHQRFARRPATSENVAVPDATAPEVESDS